VIVVTSVKRNGSRAGYANHGAAVDVAAPGGDSAAGILSTLNSGTRKPGADSYGMYSGTSMAAPQVSGVAALMLALNPWLLPSQVESLLKDAVRPFPGNCTGCGTGIVDANLAVDAAAPLVPFKAKAAAGR
jgi:serine protease